MCHVYVLGRDAYVPTVAIAPFGYVDFPPVAHATFAEPADLAALVRSRLEGGLTRVETTFKDPRLAAVPTAAAAKSWKAFEKKATLFELRLGDEPFAQHVHRLDIDNNLAATNTTRLPLATQDIGPATEAFVAWIMERSAP